LATSWGSKKPGENGHAAASRGVILNEEAGDRAFTNAQGKKETILYELERVRRRGLSLRREGRLIVPIFREKACTYEQEVPGRGGGGKGYKPLYCTLFSPGVAEKRGKKGGTLLPREGGERGPTAPFEKGGRKVSLLGPIFWNPVSRHLPQGEKGGGLL